MAGEDRDDGQDPVTPWHQSTGSVLGASVAALVAIALVVTGVMFVSRQVGEPNPAPPEYIEPVFSTTTASSTTTTETITSTSPPVTTDINDPSSTTPTSGSSTSGSPTPGSPTPGSSTPGSSSTETSPSTASAETVRPPADETGEAPTTRKRPRLNVTRTLYPVPGN